MTEAERIQRIIDGAKADILTARRAREPKAPRTANPIAQAEHRAAREEWKLRRAMAADNACRIDYARWFGEMSRAQYELARRAIKAGEKAGRFTLHRDDAGRAWAIELPTGDAGK